MTRKDKNEIVEILIDAIGALEQVRDGKDVIDIAITSLREKIKELT